MKIVGIYSILILTGCIGLMYAIYVYYNGLSGLPGLLVVYSVLALLFFKVLVIRNNRVTVYRPFWFLAKRNSIDTNYLHKARIFINTSIGGSVVVTFFNRQNEKEFEFLCQFYKFEIRRLEKHLENLGVEVEMAGSGSY